MWGEVLLYPRKLSLGVYWNHPVCLSVRLSVCPSVRLSVRLSVRPSVCPSVHIVSGPELLNPLSDLDNISHNYCPWPKDVSWPWPKVISLKSRSQYTHTQNQCPGHNSSLPCWIWIIFHTIVVHDPWVCHNLDPRSYSKGKVPVHTYPNSVSGP